MRRYSTRSGLSFGRGDEITRRHQAIAIAVLSVLIAAMVLTYFLVIRPGTTSNEALQRRYLEAMQSELKQASDSIASMSRTGGWGSYVPAATVRSRLYTVQQLYRLYLECGGEEIEGFSDIGSVIDMIDQYVTSIQSSSTSTANSVTDMQNRLDALTDNLRLAQGQDAAR